MVILEYNYLRPQTRDKHRTCIVRLLEAARLVEVQLLVVGNDDDAQVFPIVFFHHLNKSAPNAQMLTLRPDEQIMDIGRHGAIVHCTNHSNELVTIPSRKI